MCMGGGGLSANVPLLLQLGWSNITVNGLHARQAGEVATVYEVTHHHLWSGQACVNMQGVVILEYLQYLREHLKIMQVCRFCPQDL